MTEGPAPPPARAGLAPNVVGALWMLASAATFTVMTLLIKFLGGDYSAALQTFYRQAAGFIVVIPLLLLRRRAAFATSRPGLMIVRSVISTLAMTLSFYSFQAMPLADANALSFTRSLWLVPLAAFVVREQVGPLRIGAALVGFLGVLLMVRPGSEGVAVGLPAAAALAASFLFALTITSMKVMSRENTSPTALLVWAVTLGAVFAIPGAVLTWKWPTPADLALLSAMGVLGTLTQVCYIKGITVGEAAAMAPIDYSRLVFTIIAGYLLFQEVPGVWTLAGAAIVVASTLFITLREQHQAKRAAG